MWGTRFNSVTLLFYLNRWSNSVYAAIFLNMLTISESDTVSRISVLRHGSDICTDIQYDRGTELFPSIISVADQSLSSCTVLNHLHQGCTAIEFVVWAGAIHPLRKLRQ